MGEWVNQNKGQAGDNSMAKNKIRLLVMNLVK